MTTALDLVSCLALIPDRRRREGRMYSQVGVIVFSLIALLSGARSYRQIHTLIQRRLGLLNAAFPQAALPRAPAYTSVRGILQQLDPTALEQAFRRHAEGLDHSCGDTPSRFVAIDGKTLRQSFDQFADRKAAHVLSAFGVGHQIILAHAVVDEKSNEIPAVQALIAEMGLSGRVFTLDAMHCQKTFERVRESGNEVIVQVKTNQQALLRCLDHVVATQRPVAVETSRQRGRNRQEDRRITVYAAGSALERTPWSPLITAIVRVERDTLLRSAATGQWTRRRETSLYAASVMLPAQTFASAIQNHWAIENRNHWVRDVTLAEDASRIRVNPGIMARLRSQALNIARANGVTNIAHALWTAAIDPDVTFAYKGL